MVFTDKELVIIKALLDEEISVSSIVEGDTGSGTLSLLDQYKCSLSEIACKLESVQSCYQVI